MNYRAPTLSQDNFALHRALMRRDQLNASAALQRKKWQARRQARSRLLQALRQATSIRPATLEHLRSKLDLFLKTRRLTAVARTATETRTQ
jgi:hypothetical protein